MSTSGHFTLRVVGSRRANSPRYRLDPATSRVEGDLRNLCGHVARESVGCSGQCGGATNSGLLCHVLLAQGTC